MLQDYRLAFSLCPLRPLVNVPLDICEQRDVKGLYQKVRAGSIANFTGIDSTYDVPLAPDVECRTDRETVIYSTHKVLNKLENCGYIQTARSEIYQCFPTVCGCTFLGFAEGLAHQAARQETVVSSS